MSLFMQHVYVTELRKNQTINEAVEFQVIKL